MLHEFLSANRRELIALCREKVAQRPAPHARGEELVHGITPFLDQIIKTLQVEQTSEPMRSREVSGTSGGGKPPVSEISETAAQHGQELLEQGFTLEQVVHDYGDLCQSITDLAFEREVTVEIDEFRTLNRCLDNAIADAVTKYSSERDSNMARQQAQQMNEQLGSLAHELRNYIHMATLALSAIKSGHVALNGSTGAVLNRSLVGLTNLIDHALTEVRITAGATQNQLFSLAKFIAEIKVSASLEAQTRECSLTVSPVDPLLAVDADRDLLQAAVGNLLQNAFKFTPPHTLVTLNAYAQGDRILIEVEDQGNGLAPDQVETMFVPFTQGDEDKSGLGLGLSISRRSVEANQGSLSVRNIPGSGCVFTINLPRHILPQ